MKSKGSSDSAGKLTNYYPWWLDNLAEDVTGEGAAIEGTLHGAEEVQNSCSTPANCMYEQHKSQFTGNYGDKGFIEEYTCLIQGARPPAPSSQLPATPPGRPNTSW